MSDDVLASDAEREQTVARLRDASAEGRLTLDELAQRTGAAYAARTHAELVHVTAGLPATQSAAVRPAGERPRFVVGVLAPVRRQGRWRLARRTIVVAVFAPVWLDVREATLEEGGRAEISVFSLFAPVNLRVPEHVALETSVVNILGPVHETGSAGEVSPSAPQVRVNGLSLFGPTFVRLG
jgi:hypothetical protein